MNKKTKENKPQNNKKIIKKTSLANALRKNLARRKEVKK